MGKRNYNVFVGYAIFNPCAGDMRSHIADDAEVYFFLKDARRECKRLSKEHENPTLEVVKLVRL